MKERLFQVTVNGKPYCDPVGVALKNAFLQNLEGVVDNVKCEEVQEKPKLTIVEGGRK